MPLKLMIDVVAFFLGHPVLHAKCKVDNTFRHLCSWILSNLNIDLPSVFFIMTPISEMHYLRNCYGSEDNRRILQTSFSDRDPIYFLSSLYMNI